MHWKYQKLGFWGILGVKTEICIFVNPQAAPTRVQTRVLTYYTPKSVHNCGLWTASMKKTGNSSGIKFKMTVGGHLVFENYKVVTRDLIGRSFRIKSC